MSKIRKRYRVRSYRFIGVSDPYKSEREAEEERMNLSYTSPQNHYAVETIIEPVENKSEDEEHDIINSFYKFIDNENVGSVFYLQSQKEQNDIVRQLCNYDKFKEFIKDNYYIIHNFETGKSHVQEKLFPKSLLDDSKPSVEKPLIHKEGMESEILKNRRELGICPVCGCPDYIIHNVKTMGMVRDEWLVTRKCKNCGVVRIE